MSIYLLPLFGYLLGSVSTAVVVARAMGLADPRTIGSRNPGATNVLRYGGKRAAILTLAGDTLKGAIAVAIARLLTDDAVIWALTGLAVFLGHCYPVFFRFRGGKGVATALGTWLALLPWVGGLLLATWLVIAVVFRYSSAAALIAAVAAPFYVAWLAPSSDYVWVSVVMTLVLIWRHRRNIHGLLTGSEGRIGQSSQPRREG